MPPARSERPFQARGETTHSSRRFISRSLPKTLSEAVISAFGTSVVNRPTAHDTPLWIFEAWDRIIRRVLELQCTDPAWLDLPVIDEADAQHPASLDNV
jgi:hypothetical protein